jgi:4-hydroxy-3-methylbut-2-enyl diphosphate reductase
MNIEVAKSAGFCFGVNRAVNIVNELLKQEGNVYTLGPIIHNARLVKELEQKGAHIIESPSQAKIGDIIVIRSHGVPANVYEEIANAVLR